MKRRIMVFGLILAVGVMLGGARGCTLWIETDSDTYEAGDSGVATMHNDDRLTAYLPGCDTFHYQKLEGGMWVDQGPDVYCFWEGIIRPVRPGQTLETSFYALSEGTWRLHYRVSYFCLEEVPMSQADCRLTRDFYSPPFEVRGGEPVGPTCEDLGEVYFGPCEMLLGWGVVDGACEMISGCSGMGYEFFPSELACIEACATDCTMWHEAYSREVDRISTCEDAGQCMALLGTSCGCTRNLVVNQEMDHSYFWEIFEAMDAAGCRIYTTCDCPPADGFKCEEGHCGWNYI